MSALPCSQNFDCGFSSDFTNAFSQMVSEIISRITNGFNQKMDTIASRIVDEILRKNVLPEVRSLAACLFLIAHNSIPVSQDSIQAIQNILDDIEQCLDSADPATLELKSCSELKMLYLQMSQLLCMILIRDTDNAQYQGTRYAG